MKQKNLFVLVGCPASGKSTWAKEMATQLSGTYISKDAIRFGFLNPGDEYFSQENKVFKTWIKQLKDAIDSDEPATDNIFADATHVTISSRAKLFQSLDLPHRTNEVNIYIVIFYPSLEVCIERNEQREGRAYVPKSVIRRMYYSFVEPTKTELIDNNIMNLKYAGVVYKNE